MDNAHAKDIMERVVSALLTAGYNPYTQIMGYLQTGNDCYITRINGAREDIHQLSKQEVLQYIEDWKSNR